MAFLIEDDSSSTVSRSYLRFKRLFGGAAPP